MTEREYRQHPAVSRSELWYISESPEKFKYHKENPEEPTPTLLFGQLFHKMALEPETLHDEFAIIPDFDRRTKAGREAYSEFLSEAGEKIVVTGDMYALSEAMCKALYSNSFVKRLLSGEREKVFFWTDELTGEQCKCRADCITQVGEHPLIIDLKTAACAESEAFMKAAIKHGYDFQSGMYSEGVKTVTGKEHGFVFIVIEKDPPFAVNILQSDKLFVTRGYDLFREYIGIYHDCKTTGNWYGYLGRQNMINNLGLPSYLAKEVE